MEYGRTHIGCQGRTFSHVGIVSIIGLSFFLFSGMVGLTIDLVPCPHALTHDCLPFIFANAKLVAIIQYFYLNKVFIVLRNEMG